MCFLNKWIYILSHFWKKKSFPNQILSLLHFLHSFLLGFHVDMENGISAGLNVGTFLQMAFVSDPVENQVLLTWGYFSLLKDFGECLKFSFLIWLCPRIPALGFGHLIITVLLPGKPGPEQEALIHAVDKRSHPQRWGKQFIICVCRGRGQKLHLMLQPIDSLRLTSISPLMPHYFPSSPPHHIFAFHSIFYAYTEAYSGISGNHTSSYITCSKNGI